MLISKLVALKCIYFSPEQGQNTGKYNRLDTTATYVLQKKFLDPDRKPNSHQDLSALAQRTLSGIAHSNN